MLPLVLCLSLVSFIVHGAQYQCKNQYPALSYIGSTRVPTNCSTETPSYCPRSWKAGVPEGRATKEPLIHSEFITCHEGFATCGYVPIDPKSGEVLGNSGVTVGAGVDLGSKSRSYPPFLSLSTSLVNKLEPYFGLKRNLAACAAIERPLNLSSSQATTNLTNAVKEYIAKSVGKRYDEDKELNALPFASVPRGRRTAIASVWFQFGYPHVYPTFWKFITKNDWKGAVNELRNFYPDPSKQQQGDLRRRNNEADIIEATFVKCNRAIDAVILLDESGSVSRPSFRESLGFVKKLITAFPDEKLKGNDSTRFGLATFSTYYLSRFYLNSYTSQSEYLTAIDNIGKRGGGTSLGWALDRILSSQFTELRGLRSEEHGLPRVLIVLTDGQSHDNVTLPAQRVRSENIVIYAIGIGGYNLFQLQQVASSNSHVYTLSQFIELETFIATLTAATCNEPQPISLNKTIKSTTKKNEYQYFQYKVDKSSNLELTVNDISGITMVYLSRSNPHPYKFDNDMSFDTSTQKDKRIVISPQALTRSIVKRDTGTGEKVPIYVSIVASTETAEFTVEGKTCDPTQCSEGTNEIITTTAKPTSGKSSTFLSLFIIMINLYAFYCCC